MLTKIVGVIVLVIAALIALKIAGFIFSMLWKIGMVVLVVGGLYIGWRLLKR